MAMDTSQLRFPKGSPHVLVKRAKQKAERSEWARTCQRVDARDKHICQITGVHLSAGAVDGWLALERHHIEYRSRNKSRRFNDRNVLTVARAVHQLLHAGALKLLDKHGKPIRHVADLDHVAWNREMVAKTEEPCRIRKGLPVLRD